MFKQHKLFLEVRVWERDGFHLFYEARRYGVRSAMPMKKAIELCPQAVLLPVNRKRYKEVYFQVLEICERYTPDIEALSIDEAIHILSTHKLAALKKQ